MIKVPMKKGEIDIPQEFYLECCELYWQDQVDVAMHRMRLWLLANPHKCSGTVRGVKQRMLVFLKDCPLKPKIRLQAQPVLTTPTTTLETRSSFLSEMKEKVGL
jgi:hypothetical protein